MAGGIIFCAEPGHGGLASDDYPGHQSRPGALAYSTARALPAMTLEAVNRARTASVEKFCSKVRRAVEARRVASSLSESTRWMASASSRASPR